MSIAAIIENGKITKPRPKNECQMLDAIPSVLARSSSPKQEALAKGIAEKGGIRGKGAQIYANAKE
jgi:hypothetical protein